jgi:hypothetical protein
MMDRSAGAGAAPNGIQGKLTRNDSIAKAGRNFSHRPAPEPP